jgi:GT2 family glycosyltransferase
MQDFAWRGTLIRADAVESAGYPDPQYFLYGDDVDYALRIARAGFAMYYVPDAIMRLNAPPTKREGRLLGRVVSYHDSPLRLYYATRNELAVCIRNGLHVRLVRVLIYSVKVIAAILLLEGVRRGEFATAVIRGCVDGLRGRLGRHPRY